MSKHHNRDVSERDRDPPGSNPPQSNPEDRRGYQPMNQGYGEYEFGDERRRFRARERDDMRSWAGEREDARGERWSGNQGWGGGQGSWGGGPQGWDREREHLEQRRMGMAADRGGDNRWDRDQPEWQGREWQGREGYGRQNEWSAWHGAWSDPAHTDARSAGAYAEGGRYYGERSDSARERYRQPEEGPYRGRGPKGYRRSDDRIREDVCERLTHDSWLDASNIDIEVHEGEVTLSGTVDSRQAKRRAEDIIEDVSGIRDIHNQLRVDAGALQGQNTTDVAPVRNDSPQRAA